MLSEGDAALDAWIQCLFKLGDQILGFAEATRRFEGEGTYDICTDCSLKEALRLERTTKKMLERLQKYKRATRRERRAEARHLFKDPSGHANAVVRGQDN